MYLIHTEQTRPFFCNLVPVPNLGKFIVWVSNKTNSNLIKVKWSSVYIYWPFDLHSFLMFQQSIYCLLNENKQTNACISSQRIYLYIMNSKLIICIWNHSYALSKAKIDVKTLVPPTVRTSTVNWSEKQSPIWILSWFNKER